MIAGSIDSGSAPLMMTRSASGSERAQPANKSAAKIKETATLKSSLPLVNVAIPRNETLAESFHEPQGRARLSDRAASIPAHGTMNTDIRKSDIFAKISGARPVPGRSSFGSHRHVSLVVRRRNFQRAARLDGARSIWFRLRRPEEIAPY